MPDLLSGSPVTGVVPTNSSSVTTLPDWYTNYAKDIIDQQAQVSALPYTPYQGQQVAGTTALQQAGYNQTEAGATAAQPGFNSALSLAGAAVPTAAPLQASGVNYLNQSTNALGLQAAAPFLGQADQTSASNVGNYMSPYESAVTDQIATLGNRNLQENVLPGIQDQFTSSGQGTTGSRQGEYIGRAVRQTQDDITAAQAASLNSGYQGALSASAADEARQAGLAGTAGSLGAAQQGALQTAGLGEANIGTAAGNLDLSAANTTGSLAAADQTSQLQGAGALQAAGTQQQATNQASDTAAYNNFLAQQGWSQQQINAMTSTVGALQPAIPKSTTASGTVPATAYSPSAAATLASLGLDAAGIAKILGSGG